MSKYWICTPKGELIQSETPLRHKVFFAHHKPTKRTWPLDFFDLRVAGSNKVRINDFVYDKDDIVICTAAELDDLMGINSDVLYSDKICEKDLNRKLPNPNTEVYPDFTDALIRCLLEHNGENMKQDNYDKGLAIIREISSLANKDKDISLKKAIELLNVYGLSMKELLNPKYVK